MFVLDTNVISESFRPRPDPGVAVWMDTAIPENIFVTAPSKAELLVGLAYMPEGRRKADFGSVIGAFFSNWLKTPVLSFGTLEAETYARIVADRRRMGRPVAQFDAQIAAITKTRGFSIVTRNVRDFEHCGIQIIDPWSGSPA
jgi:predicted nucleic acid-binding protein